MQTSQKSSSTISEAGCRWSHQKSQSFSVAYSMGVHRTIELLDEFCGIYGIINPTGRALLAMKHAAAQGLWGPNCAQGQGVYAFTDEHGRIEPRFTRSGDEIPWQPSFDRHGSFSNMVKRPPLTTRDNLIAAARDLNQGSSRHPGCAQSSTAGCRGIGLPSRNKACHAALSSASVWGRAS